MDLTTEQGMQTYLQGKWYPRCTVHRLPEGVGGFVYRVITNTADQETSTSRASVVVKHVQAYAARAKQYKLAQSRMNYEKRTLEFLASLDPQIEGVRAPEVIHFDQESWVLVMEDVGDCPSVKGWLQKDVNLTAAENMGAALGKFLATVHDASSGRDDLLKNFNGNLTAKDISGSVYFGTLPQAAKRFGHAGDHIEMAAKQGEKDVHEANEVLTLGDFWTGNVLRNTQDGQLFVVDLELSKPGTPDFDIGQMAAELYCVAAFRSKDVGTRALHAFLKTYRLARKGNFDASKVAIRIAAHLCVIMPGAWSNEASQGQIKEQVKLADELLKLGVERDVAELRQSIVGPLVA